MLRVDRRHKDDGRALTLYSHDEDAHEPDQHAAHEHAEHAPVEPRDGASVNPGEAGEQT